MTLKARKNRRISIFLLLVFTYQMVFPTTALALTGGPSQPEFAGLRDYPILKSPNQAQVTVQAVGNLVNEDVTQSCSLLCEVLVDD